MSDRFSFLDPAWCDWVVTRAANAGGALRDVRVELRSAGAPAGLGTITFVVEGGRLVSCAPEAGPKADVVLKMAWNDVVAVFAGELDPGAAFMTGAMKSEGPTGPLLDLLSVWRQPAVRSARAELVALTDVPT